MKNCLLAGCAGLLISAAGFAQAAHDFDALDAQLKYRLGPEGQFQIWPDPNRGDATNPAYGDIFNPTRFLSNSGVAGWLMMVGMGDSDLASMTNAPWIMKTLGRDSVAQIVEAIDAKPDASEDTIELLRIQAMRAAQQRQLTDAIPSVERATVDDALPRLTRLIAKEVLASLKGETYRPRPARTLAPLAVILRDSKITPDAVVVIDQYRLPNARSCAKRGYDLGLSMTKKGIGLAGGKVGLSQWAGAQSIASLTNIFGFEAARIAGNLRIDRTVSIIDINDANPEQSSSRLIFDGWFDVDGLHRALQMVAAKSPELSIDRAGDVITIEQDGPERMRMTATQHRIDFTASSDSMPGREVDQQSVESAIAALAVGDAPIRVRMLGTLPEMVPPQIQRFANLSAVDLWIPKSMSEPLRASVAYRDEATAKQLQTLARALPRTINSAIEASPFDDPALDQLMENVDEISIERDGKTLSMSVPLAGIDIDALMRAVIR